MVTVTHLSNKLQMENTLFYKIGSSEHHDHVVRVNIGPSSRTYVINPLRIKTPTDDKSVIKEDMLFLQYLNKENVDPLSLW